MTSSTGNDIDDAAENPASANSVERKISKFIVFNRWTHSATNGGGLTQGTPTTLTWSLPANGVTTDDFENPDAPNDLLTMLDTTFGAGTGNDLTQRPWFHIFDKSLGRFEELAGLTFNFITQDDGAPSRPENFGVQNVRADVRIMGKNIDGNAGANTLAYNAFPNDGDMTIDTSNSGDFNDATDDFRFFRNTLMHEFMHGLGIEHVDSSNANFLIEPTIDVSFDGPQLDDILAIQRSYGDALEKLNGNAFATAINLGTIAPFATVSRGTLGDSTVVSSTETDFVSIDDETDQDFYKFTVDTTGSVSITLSPRGSTYMVGPENGAQAAFNAKNQSDLTVRLLGEDGVTVLETRNAGGLGVNEVIQDFALGSPGTYFVQVSGATADTVQLYGLDVSFTQTPGAQILGRVFNDADLDGTQDPGEAGLPNIRVFSDENGNSVFDVGETSVTTDASGDYAITGIFTEGTFNIRAQLPANRQFTSPVGGLNSVELLFDQVATNINFGTRLLPVGTSGSDAFVLTYSPTNVTVTISTNGGPVSNIGTFPLTSPLVVDGSGGTDSVRIVGTSGEDEFFVDSSSAVETNLHQVTLTSIEQRTLAGAAGGDDYIFDTDAALGAFTLDESGGGIDQLDFFLSDRAVNINLGTATSQVINSNLSLALGSGATFENVFGGQGADNLIGNALSNTLNGSGGIDTLIGAAGSDFLFGGANNDTYLFGPATVAEADQVTENLNEGTDTLSFVFLTTAVALRLDANAVQSVHTNRTLKLNAPNTFENAIGGTGSDSLIGNLLSNTLTGGPGTDTLVGAAGSDNLLGGANDDSYLFGPATAAEVDQVTENLNEGIDSLNFTNLTTNVVLNLGVNVNQAVHTNRTLKLNAPNTFENAFGGIGADTLTGNALSNNMNGFNGDDTLNGAAGSDVLLGGGNNDTYLFGPALAAEVDQVVETANQGTDTLNFAFLTTSITLNLGTPDSQTVHANRLLKLNFMNIENAIGGTGADTLTGNGLNNSLNGGLGADTLNGAAGNDTLIGSTGDDTFVFAPASAAEADTINEGGSGGTDTLDFSAITTDLLVSLESNAAQSVHTNRTITLLNSTSFENVIGGAGHDVLVGNSLVNRLTGNNGRDILVGGLGADILFGGNDDDILVSGVVNTGMMWTQPVNFTEFYTKVRQVWGGSDTYSDRAFTLFFPSVITLGKVGYLRPVTTFLILTQTTVFRNVFDDGIRDELTGNAGLDLFFAGSLDAVLDRVVASETLHSVTAP